MLPEYTKNASNSQSQNFTVALNLARSGWAIFPADPATKAPMPGVRWKEAATPDPAKVAAWWLKWLDAMPALPTGARNGVCVVDLDRGKGKDEVAAYRAPGAPQSEFAAEMAVNELADKLGMDPIELRLKNAAKAGTQITVAAPCFLHSARPLPLSRPRPAPG